MTDKEWDDYFPEVLAQPDKLAEQTPKDIPLHKLADEVCKPLAALIGYHIG